MRRRQTNPFKMMATNCKRKATKNRNDLAYMMIWHEEPPKKHHLVTKKRTALW